MWIQYAHERQIMTAIITESEIKKKTERKTRMSRDDEWVDKKHKWKNNKTATVSEHKRVKIVKWETQAPFNRGYESASSQRWSPKKTNIYTNHWNDMKKAGFEHIDNNLLGVFINNEFICFAANLSFVRQHEISTVMQKALEQRT